MIPCLHCYCGESVHLEEGNTSKVVRCPKCGSGLALHIHMQRYVRTREGWQEADTTCEGCGKALLWEQVAWSDDDGVHLCKECAPKKGAEAS